MREHERLRPELRLLASGAALQGSAHSLTRVWDRALRQKGCRKLAVERLNAAGATTLAREAPAIWGDGCQALTGALAKRR
jgi:Family of unknown function (DUF6525)